MTRDTHARKWCEHYFRWYNEDHHHSGLAGFTPQQVFTGTYTQVAQQKQQALDLAYAKYPQRFVNGKPKVPMPPTYVAINPIVPGEEPSNHDDRVIFSTLPAAEYRKSTLSF